MDIRSFSKNQLAKCIQFTKISPMVTKDEIVKHFELCGEHAFHAAMVPMCYVPLGKEILEGTDVKIATFFGFGAGHESLYAKIALMRECLSLGADEVDYQPNMSLFLSGNDIEFANETKMLLDASHGIVIKAMLELGYMKIKEDKIRAIKLLNDAGLTWIKNSSGAPTGGGPATAEDIKLLRKHMRPECKIKASGKVNSFERLVTLFDAGAELAGSSNGIDIINKVMGSSSGY